MAYKEYKVIHVQESGCGTIFLGAAAIPITKMEATLNKAAAEGWQVVFQLVEKRRMMLFWTRESVVVTLGR